MCNINNNAYLISEGKVRV